MRLITLLLLMACLCGCSDRGGRPETLLNVSYDEEVMEVAIAKARRDVDFFVKEIGEPVGSDHAVKIALTDGDISEHVWLTEVSFADGKFTGKINNTPSLVKNAAVGESKTVEKEAIVDWMFMYEFQMYGNFTIRPFLAELPDSEANKIRLLLGE